MAENTSANVTIDDEAGAFAGSGGYVAVFGCVERNDDCTPRVYASSKALMAQHGYSQGADYVAMHVGENRLPVVFCGLPTATVGTIGRQDASGVTGNSVITVAAGSAGVLEETSAILTVTSGGTIGTDQIKFSLSLDGGRTSKPVRLGTDSSYTVPYVGFVINFAAGTLAVDDEYTFATTAPRWDAAGLTAARTALASQHKKIRTILVVGDLTEDDDAEDVVDELNLYETENQRFSLARVQVRDRLQSVAMARVTRRMTGTPTITFLEVGGTGDTITRSTGSFISDGFAVGMVVTVAGAVASTGYNNITGKVTTVTALVLTLDTADLINEGPISTVSIVGSHGLVFATTTATRSGGSWLSDGFAVGDDVTFSGTVSNNISVEITGLTATVMTFASGGATETIGTRSVTCTSGETMAAFIAEMDDEYSGVDDEKRIDIGIGRGVKKSPITGWRFRRPVQWAASLREYSHDIQIPCWRKADGPCDGWDLTDDDGTIVEYDENTDGGALAGRFTCFKTWANGPEGAFIALSLTRASEDSLLSRTHNMQVVNEACTVTQATTEDAIGQVLVLNADGTGSSASLSLIEKSVNKALAVSLLQVGKEGVPRASSAVWSASRNAILNVPGATLPGVLALLINGTLEKIDTSVRIQTAGA